jgi:hypothetical protein
MMAAQTSQPNKNKYDSEKDRIFHEAIDVLAKCQPFTSTDAKGKKQIAFLVHLFEPKLPVVWPITLGGDPAITASKIIRDEWGCDECRKRIRKMFNLMDADGDGILEPDADDVALTEEQKAMIAKVKDFIHERMRDRAKVPEETWQLRVVASTEEWQKTFDGLQEKQMTKAGVHHYQKEISSIMNLQTKSKGGFDHYYMNPSEVSSKDVDLLLMNKGFHRYQRLMSTMFDKFMRQEDWDGMITSLEIMLKILEGATYGHKFVASTTWALNCFKRSEKPFYRMSMIERANFIGTAICTAPIREEIGNQAVITFYHQFNDNILGLLESAKDEYSMRSMVEMRLNPNYYQQKTAAPKAGAVAMAAEALGQFDVHIATVNQLETDPRFSDTIKIGKDSVATPGEETDIYAGLRTKGQTSSIPKGAAGFASRARGKKDDLPSFVRTNYDGKYTMTICELMNHVKSGDITSVEVYYKDDLTDVMVTSTTLSQDKLIHPHTWLFLLNESPRFSKFTRLKVTHIVPILTNTHTNCLFILEGGREALRRRPYNPNACLGEFLNSKYHACKSTFMEVGRKIGTKVPPPSEGELAFGVGVSKASGLSLNRSVEIYINGNRKKPITITKWL